MIKNVKSDCIFVCGKCTEQEQKGHSYQFFPLTFTNVGISSKTFLTFTIIFYTFIKLQDHKQWQYQIIELEPKALLKTFFFFFSLNSYKIELMITSPIECQNYQTLVTWPHLQYNLSHIIIFCQERYRQNLRRHKLY